MKKSVLSCFFFVFNQISLQLKARKRLLAGPGGAEIDLKNKSRFALFLRLDATGAAVPIVYQCCYPGWATLALPSPKGGGFAA